MPAIQGEEAHAQAFAETGGQEALGPGPQLRSRSREVGDPQRRTGAGQTELFDLVDQDRPVQVGGGAAVQPGADQRAVPAALLVGWAFASVGMAAATYLRSWADFDYVQLAVLPMFLFSATFFPLATYPPGLQLVVQATPLYHGVAMIRDLMLGTVGPGLAVHVLYLAAMGTVGTLWTGRRIGHLLLR